MYIYLYAGLPNRVFPFFCFLLLLLLFPSVHSEKVIPPLILFLKKIILDFENKILEERTLKVHTYIWDATLREKEREARVYGESVKCKNFLI